VAELAGRFLEHTLPVDVMQSYLQRHVAYATFASSLDGLMQLHKHA
jgi:hypothetical protein